MSPIYSTYLTHVSCSGVAVCDQADNIWHNWIRLMCCSRLHGLFILMGMIGLDGAYRYLKTGLLSGNFLFPRQKPRVSPYRRHQLLQ